MKRKVLAILVPALLMAGAAHAAEMYNKNGNKVDLYGKIDARHTFSDHPGDDGDETYVQIGFKGETQITNDVIGYGQWEYKTYANNTESAGDTSFNRLAYAGLKYGEYGSFDYGRNYGVVYDVEAWTDMLPVFGGDSYTWTDNFMVGRANGVATYRNADFFGLVEGLNFALQYQGANEGQDATEDQEGTKNGHNDVRFQNGDGFGMSTSYDFSGDLSGLTLGAAYSSSDRTNEQEAKGIQDSARFAGGKTAEVWTVGAKYDANSVYLAMMYAQTRNMTPYGDTGIADETQNFEAVAQYQFDFGLRPSLAWVYSKGKDMTYPGNAGNPQGQHGDMDLVNYIDVGMTYNFNKNFSTYVDYKINMLDNDESFYEANGISTDDIVGVGMTYQF
ncbi:porin OmpC [Enterobacter ludwigii]|uniref:porin OmpC n=1 Tax=Enterobacter TaxID=547 RepID=UPI000358E90C|nr:MULTISPECIES: porin OmpC [Enterobacter]EKS6745268.1 porin OmpC [Enterobacter ludwigii]ELP5692113.1 porin OmpC [Enterobacter ludwigii]EPR38403.1 porin Gram-negative type [Enterobacter ludwigii]KLR46046.1 porin [Enterobacter ludwigii]MDR6364568.1 outer membrane protein N [Enterobacter sp. SORGH_AS_0287]